MQTHKLVASKKVQCLNIKLERLKLKLETCSWQLWDSVNERERAKDAAFATYKIKAAARPCFLYSLFLLLTYYKRLFASPMPNEPLCSFDFPFNGNMRRTSNSSLTSCSKLTIVKCEQYHSPCINVMKKRPLRQINSRILNRQ